MTEPLLLEAERLIRRNGYSAFTLDNLASNTSISKSEVLEHFPNEESVCRELIRRHFEHLKCELRDIRMEYHDAESRLVAFACLLSEKFEKDLPSFSGMLANSRSCVPQTIRRKTAQLLQLQLVWIQEVIQEPGVLGGDLQLPPEHAARLLLSALEGDAVIDCAFGATDPMATSFTAVMRSLGISGR
jgi:AcrR family transcriptional regulator